MLDSSMALSLPLLPSRYSLIKSAPTAMGGTSSPPVAVSLASCPPPPPPEASPPPASLDAPPGPTLAPPAASLLVRSPPAPSTPEAPDEAVPVVEAVVGGAPPLAAALPAVLSLVPLGVTVVDPALGGPSEVAITILEPP